MRHSIAKGRNDVSAIAGDSVTVLGNVVSVSGIGSQAQVLVQTQSGNQFTCQGSDCNAPAGQGNALSYSHQQYGQPGDQVSIPATILAVLSGSGSVALLSVKLTSGLIVTVTSGACTCADQSGIPAGNL